MNKTFKRINSNGREFQLLTLPGTNLYKFEVINLYGANIERVIEKGGGPNVYGLSHFIEHLGFRAPQDYSTNVLLDRLKTEGTYNASTDHDRINYWFKTTMEHVNIGTRLVCNFALNNLMRIPDDEFEIEKKVVYNEAKRYADDDQTMFYFNTTPTVCGYNKEDNIIGIPETIETFTLDQAVMLKKVFLANGRQLYNITYDPMVMTEDAVLSLVNAELDRFPLPIRDSELDIVDDNYRELLRTPRVGHFTLESESEQAMTTLFMDNVRQSWTSQIANNYLGRYATNTSLDDIIREQNGLTYGVGFYEDLVSYKPFTILSCDVSRGTEDRLMELFNESINKSVQGFTETEYNKLMKTARLKRTMRNVNQENYDTLFWMSLWYPNLIDANPDLFAENLDAAATYLDGEFATYEKIQEHLTRTQQLVNDEQWSLVRS